MTTSAAPLDMGQPNAVQHLRQADLAARWRMSERTLERWRYRKVGPPFLKLSGGVLYRLADIEAYEADHVKGAQASPPVSPRNDPDNLAELPVGRPSGDP